ncbi:TetR/AcrR family transcriptional regulator [Aeromicrobium sp. UC242_57]|uniref:TetR/AcrR family transcriptional regulator n=1 Tax=Aeromicrobium sp. UC242_57 TaxID=3374624 RepID=UPI0037A28D32
MVALSELLRQQPSSRITISALCQAAGVSRPTFYQHFSTVDDVLTAALDERMEQVRAAVMASERDDGRTSVARFLADVIDDPQAYKELLSAGMLLAGPSDTLQLLGVAATRGAFRARRRIDAGPRLHISRRSSRRPRMAPVPDGRRHESRRPRLDARVEHPGFDRRLTRACPFSIDSQRPGATRPISLTA